MTPTPCQIEACLERYKAWVSRQLLRTRWCMEDGMDDAYKQREDWFRERQEYLEAELAKAWKARK